ncbi:hypothetical protein KIPB_013842, partial [Kipferlia bialata]|eukprot:g13842.t1
MLKVSNLHPLVTDDELYDFCRGLVPVSSVCVHHLEGGASAECASISLFTSVGGEEDGMVAMDEGIDARREETETACTALDGLFLRGRILSVSIDSIHGHGVGQDIETQAEVGQRIGASVPDKTAEECCSVLISNLPPTYSEGALRRLARDI